MFLWQTIHCGLATGGQGVPNRRGCRDRKHGGAARLAPRIQMANATGFCTPTQERTHGQTVGWGVETRRQNRIPVPSEERVRPGPCARKHRQVGCAAISLAEKAHPPGRTLLPERLIVDNVLRMEPRRHDLVVPHLIHSQFAPLDSPTVSRRGSGDECDHMASRLHGARNRKLEAAACSIERSSDHAENRVPALKESQMCSHVGFAPAHICNATGFCMYLIIPFYYQSVRGIVREHSPSFRRSKGRNNVRRGKALSSGGCEPRATAVAPVGSSQGGLRRQRCRLKHSGDKGPRMAAQQPCGPEREVNAEQASKHLTQKPTLRCLGEGRRQIGKRATYAPICICRGIGASTHGR